MPLLGSGLLLGAAIAAAGGCDPVGAVLCGGLGNAMAAWLPGNCITLPLGMVAAGAAVSGMGLFQFTSDEHSFGPVLAAGVGATDAPGILKWTAVAKGIIDHMTLFGRVVPAAFVANPLGGPVTGVGTVTFLAPLFVPPLSTDLGLTDAANVATWLLLGTQIIAHITANAQALSLGFTSPPGGGPLVGVSTIV